MIIVVRHHWSFTLTTTKERTVESGSANNFFSGAMLVFAILLHSDDTFFA